MREALRTFMWWIGAPLVLFTLLYVVVWAHYRIDAPRLISGPQEDEVIAILRRGIRGAPPRPEAVAKIVDIPLRGPLWVTLFRRGEAALRLRRDEKTLRSAIAAATSELSRRPEVQAWRPEERHAIRIKVDITLAEGPIISAIPLFFAKGIVPGLDGLGIEVNGKHRAYILPDELYKRQLLAGYRPFFFMHEFKTGIDLRAVINTFARDLSLSIEAWRDASKRFFRLRLQSFVEAPPDEKPGEGASRNALDVVRLRVPVDRINKSTVIQAVKRSADYILRQIEPSGRFHYIYYPLSDRHDGGRDYSLPRHAGTTWFLSLAYAKLRKARYRRGARRAIRYLATHAVPPSCKTKSFACVGTEAYADLGSAGLTILAIVEYTEATGDRLYVPLARRLGQFVLDMQKDNGDFCHQYAPRKKRKNCQQILLYYTGEATLGLARLQRLTADPRYLGPIERALDFLVGEKYNFFLGQFFISEDHWTCIAAEAAYPAVKKRRYLDFCLAFARLNRRTQIRREDALGDLWGAFAITPFFMPHNTPVGSRSEANVATYLLSQHWKAPNSQVLKTIRSAMRYLVDQQIRRESAYLLPNPVAAIGGLTQTPTRSQIRIDYVQHAAAAMTRAIPLIPKGSWPPAR